jgi:hypothetical protein
MCSSSSANYENTVWQFAKKSYAQSHGEESSYFIRSGDCFVFRSVRKHFCVEEAGQLLVKRLV